MHEQTQRTASCPVAVRRWLMASLVLVLSSLAAPGRACPEYPSEVPNSNCLTCHQGSQAGPRNDFATQWLAGCVSCVSTCSGCSYTEWSSCFVSLQDSDGDGFTNDEELSAGFPPGEANSIDECTSGLNHCLFVAPCTADGPLRDDYTCVCPAGLDAAGSDGRDDGTGCLDVNECVEGLDDCGDNSTCDNTPSGSFDCPCDMGFFGSGHADQGCTALNFCDPDPCSPLSVCQSLPAGADCGACPQGYAGDPFDPAGCTPVDACVDGGGCSPQVTCNALPAGRSCSACPAGWSGSGFGPDGCVEDVCAACSAFASCSPGGSPVCTCNVGFTGDGTTCKDIDECAPGGSAVCGEHEECSNLFGSHLCVCASGYHLDGGHCVADASAWLVLVGMLFGRQRRQRVSLFSRGARRRAGHRALAPLTLTLTLTLTLLALVSCGSDSSPRSVPGGSGGSISEAGASGESASGGSAGSALGGAGGSVAGAGGVSSTGGAGGAPAPASRACTSSRECSAGEWCNPGGDVCQRRDPLGTAVTFQDVFPILHGLPCPSCHLPDGVGLATLSGFGPLRFDDFDLAYAHLVADGVNCETSQHRLCVEDPRSSLLITKVFEGLSNQPELVIYNDWTHPQLQQILRWIASGAPRRGACGNRVVDPGEECDQGLNPPARCAYGEATCELCTDHCRLAPAVAGPRCGDGNIDEGHEVCDDGNTAIEAADPNGGVVCGAECTLVQGL